MFGEGVKDAEVFAEGAMLEWKVFQPSP